MTTIVKACLILSCVFKLLYVRRTSLHIKTCYKNLIVITMTLPPRLLDEQLILTRLSYKVSLSNKEK